MQVMGDKKGLLLCSRYSVAPNFFGYCGPNENSALIDHLCDNHADKEVGNILTQFETLYLYLLLIARANKIENVFDHRVVEAYWVGNSLLETVSSADYTSLLDERFNLRKKIGDIPTDKLQNKIQKTRIYPHHSFHVFNIFKRTGHDVSVHTLATMDSCRIAWGTVTGESADHESIYVLLRPLVQVRNKLDFGQETVRMVQAQYRKKSFLRIKNGDRVSIHWGYVCDVLTKEQVKNLEFYTQKAVDFFNTS